MPESAPPARARERRRTPAPVGAICAASGMAGAAVLAGTLLATPSPLRHLPLFACFAVGLAVLQVAPLRFTHRGQGEAIAMEEAFFVPMALLLTPAETLLVMGGAVAFGNAYQRKGLLKSVFNVGQVLVAASAGLAVTRLLGVSSGEAVDGGAVAAAVLGALVYDGVSTTAVTAVIAALQRSPFLEVYRDGAVVRLATYVGGLSLGVLVAAAAGAHAWALPVVVVPVAMFQLVYRRALGEWRERHRVQALYEASTAIRGSMDTGVVRERLLSAARDLLEADRARLVEGPESPAPDALRADVDGVAVEVSGRIGGGRWEASDLTLLGTLAGMASGALRNATLFEQIRAITDSLGEGVLALDERGRVTFANPAADRMLGGRGELPGRLLHDVVHAGAPAACGTAEDCRLTAVLTSGTARDDDDVFALADGSCLPVAHTVSPVVQGGAAGAVMAFRDITERKAFEQELSHQAFHDALTGLYNRALLVDRLEQAHARAARNGTTYAVLFVGLDRFKVVNESLGHQAGDELLVAVAGRLRSCVRPGDTLARFGGDEFVALLEDLGAPEDAEAVADRVLHALQQTFRVHGRDLPISASIGVVVGDARRPRAERYLRDADVAMRRAKARGKGRYEVFRAEAESGELERLDLELALRLAIERGELELHYQPIVSLETVSVVGLEALVRWRHPAHGLVPPGEFIPLAEESGLILPLGRWVLAEACRQLREWTDRHPSLASLVVSVNLSARQFRQPDLSAQVEQVLADTGLDAGRLCLEVTESVMMDDTEAAVRTLRELKELGTCVSVDDFGTGYSSLGYLKRFPADFVKIDRSFVTDLEKGDVDSEIVRAVVRLSAAIGMRAVAEGVETEEQLRCLRDLGCPLVQGYFLSPPQPAAEIEALLGERATPRGDGAERVRQALWS